MRLFLLNVALCCSFAALGQRPDVQIRALYRQERFDTLVQVARTQTEVLSDTALLLAGTAALFLHQEAEAGLCYSRCTERFPNYGMGWYTLSLYQKDHGDPVAAQHSVEKALALEPKNPDYWIQKGALLDEKGLPDSSIVVYQAVTFFPEYPPEIHVLIGDTYYALQKYTFALTAYLEGLQALPPESAEHLRCRYNTACAAYMLGDYDQAETYLQSILRELPGDLQALEKMVQVSYGRQKYREAETYAAALYAAYREGKLPEALSDAFCIDQFNWREARVYAYERYADSPEMPIKYLFYVVDRGEKVQIRVQLERKPGKSGVYQISMDKGEKHQVFSSFNFSAHPDYSKLRQSVLDVLEGRTKK
ncbi:MAG: tetratricopeptide repeat protein [Lewinellaceae bacterium]|nr:tetratricopeptide repeat protein [Lewinellaceae bacterium]